MEALSGILICLSGVLKTIIICLALFPLSKTGYLIRKGFIYKRGLRRIRLILSQQKMIPNENFRKENIKATLYIILPIAGWLIFYIIFFHFLPFSTYKWALFALIAPILGFFGIFFKPSDDPSDYLEDLISK